MDKKKTSWDYQRGRYKQINIKFDLNDDRDVLIYYYLRYKTKNTSQLLKKLVYVEMLKGCDED